MASALSGTPLSFQQHRPPRSRGPLRVASVLFLLLSFFILSGLLLTLLAPEDDGTAMGYLARKLRRQQTAQQRQSHFPLAATLYSALAPAAVHAGSVSSATNALQAALVAHSRAAHLTCSDAIVEEQRDLHSLPLAAPAVFILACARGWKHASSKDAQELIQPAVHRAVQELLRLTTQDGFLISLAHGNGERGNRSSSESMGSSSSSGRALPMVNALEQTQAAAAFRAAARLLADDSLHMQASIMLRRLHDLYVPLEEDLEGAGPFYLAVPAPHLELGRPLFLQEVGKLQLSSSSGSGSGVGSASSKRRLPRALTSQLAQMLFYLDPFDLPSHVVARMAAAALELESPVGISTGMKPSEETAGVARGGVEGARGGATAAAATSGSAVGPSSLPAAPFIVSPIEQALILAGSVKHMEAYMLYGSSRYIGSSSSSSGSGTGAGGARKKKSRSAASATDSGAAGGLDGTLLAQRLAAPLDAAVAASAAAEEEEEELAAYGEAGTEEGSTQQQVPSSSLQEGAAAATANSHSVVVRLLKHLAEASLRMSGILRALDEEAWGRALASQLLQATLSTSGSGNVTAAAAVPSFAPMLQAEAGVHMQDTLSALRSIREMEASASSSSAAASLPSSPAGPAVSNLDNYAALARLSHVLTFPSFIAPMPQGIGNADLSGFGSAATAPAAAAPAAAGPVAVGLLADAKTAGKTVAEKLSQGWKKVVSAGKAVWSPAAPPSVTLPCWDPLQSSHLRDSLLRAAEASSAEEKVDSGKSRAVLQVVSRIGSSDTGRSAALQRTFLLTQGGDVLPSSALAAGSTAAAGGSSGQGKQVTLLSSQDLPVELVLGYPASARLPVLRQPASEAAFLRSLKIAEVQQYGPKKEPSPAAPGSLSLSSLCTVEHVLVPLHLSSSAAVGAVAVGSVSTQSSSESAFRKAFRAVTGKGNAPANAAAASTEEGTSAAAGAAKGAAKKGAASSSLSLKPSLWYRGYGSPTDVRTAAAASFFLKLQAAAAAASASASSASLALPQQELPSHASPIHGFEAVIAAMTRRPLQRLQADPSKSFEGSSMTDSMTWADEASRSRAYRELDQWLAGMERGGDRGTAAAASGSAAAATDASGQESNGPGRTLFVSDEAAEPLPLDAAEDAVDAAEQAAVQAAADKAYLEGLVNADAAGVLEEAPAVAQITAAPLYNRGNTAAGEGADKSAEAEAAGEQEEEDGDAVNSWENPEAVQALLQKAPEAMKVAQPASLGIEQLAAEKAEERALHAAVDELLFASDLQPAPEVIAEGDASAGDSSAGGATAEDQEQPPEEDDSSEEELSDVEAERLERARKLVLQRMQREKKGQEEDEQQHANTPAAGAQPAAAAAALSTPQPATVDVRQLYSRICTAAGKAVSPRKLPWQESCCTPLAAMLDSLAAAAGGQEPAEAVAALADLPFFSCKRSAQAGELITGGRGAGAIGSAHSSSSFSSGLPPPGSISCAAIEDNYCDCNEQGEDEPLSGACTALQAGTGGPASAAIGRSLAADGLFFCKSGVKEVRRGDLQAAPAVAGSNGAAAAGSALQTVNEKVGELQLLGREGGYIPSSKVRDGIPDCVDGEDEAALLS